MGFNQNAYATQEAIVVGEQPKLKDATTEDAEVQAMADDLVKQADTPELKQRLQEILKRPQEREIQDVQPEHVQVAQAKTENDNSMPFRQTNHQDTKVSQAPIRIKSAPNAKYALQVGSYPQISEANTKIKKWKQKGYPAYLMIADIPDRGRWYRVRLGGFASRDEARKYKQKIESVEQVETIVVLNEQ